MSEQERKVAVVIKDGDTPPNMLNKALSEGGLEEVKGAKVYWVDEEKFDPSYMAMSGCGSYRCWSNGSGVV